MSAVVLMELTASAKDDSQRKRYERLFRVYQEDNSLIVPDQNDWLLASRILYWFAQSNATRLAPLNTFPVSSALCVL
jgi:hypothetical protein